MHYANPFHWCTSTEWKYMSIKTRTWETPTLSSMAIVHLTKDIEEKTNWWEFQFKIKFKNDDKILRGALVPLHANKNAKQLPKSAKLQQHIA